MTPVRTQATTIDEYIADFPTSTQKLLKRLRAAIKKAAPEAGEKISYAIPTFTLGGNLVHFAGYDHHIGFYPGAEAIKAFRKELSGYKGAKGSVQFPIDKPLPLDVVTDIVRFRVMQNMMKKEKKEQIKGRK